MPNIRLSVSHQRVLFRNRRFNQGESPKPTSVEIAAVPRVRFPNEDTVRAAAHRYALSSAFRERKRQQMERGEFSRLADFMKFYKFVAERIREYRGRDAIEIDIFLGLKDFVNECKQANRSVNRYDLDMAARRWVDARESLIEFLGQSERLVARPMAPKDARERGGEAYTEAAMKRHKDAHIKDRVTVMARLPGYSEELFITLGPATRGSKRLKENRVRKIISIQSEAEWNSWKRTRTHERKEYRNFHPRPRRTFAAN